MTRRFVSLQRTGSIATITFDRREALNALTLDMIEELDGLLAQIDGAPDICAVLLRGEGRAFMAGGDLDICASPKTRRPPPAPRSVP